MSEMKTEKQALITSLDLPMKHNISNIAEMAHSPSLVTRKRKADSDDHDEIQSDVSSEPRKKRLSSAFIKPQSPEREFKRAQDRLTVAEARKRELAETFESILLVKKVSNFSNFTSILRLHHVQAQKLHQEADQIEMDNMELQVRQFRHTY